MRIAHINNHNRIDYYKFGFDLITCVFSRFAIPLFRWHWYHCQLLTVYSTNLIIRTRAMHENMKLKSNCLNSKMIYVHGRSACISWAQQMHIHSVGFSMHQQLRLRSYENGSIWTRAIGNGYAIHYGIIMGIWTVRCLVFNAKNLLSSSHWLANDNFPTSIHRICTTRSHWWSLISY